MSDVTSLLKKYESYVAFSVACLVVFLVISLSVLLIGAPPRERGPGEEQDSSSQIKCDQLLAPLGIVATPGDKPQAGGVKQDRYIELCQQLRTSLGTEDAAYYAKRQYYLAIGNLVIIVVAAAFAWRAAHHTKRQANIAETAYRNLERPYVIERVWRPSWPTKNDGSKKPPQAVINFKNYGREPAVLIQVAAHLVISSGPPCDDVLMPSHIATGNDILVSGADGRDYTVTLASFDWVDGMDAYDARSRDLWMAGEFWYCDPRGQTYTVPFEWKYSRAHDAFLKRARPANRTANSKHREHLQPPSFKMGEVADG